MRIITRGALAALTCAVCAAPAAQAAPSADSSALRGAVSDTGLLEHMDAFQKIADANDGTRASGTPGYDASAAYVADKLRGAGYQVTIQPFKFNFFSENAPAEFSRVSPDPETYTEPDDFATMEYSGSGDVTADVVPTNDVQIPPGPTASSSNSGCEAADFPAAVAGNVALVQRGTCTFGEKAQNAEAAGATAIVIFNEGQEGRTDAINGTLGDPVGIPAIGTTFAIGEDLYNRSQLGTVTVRVVTSTTSEARDTVNVIGDTPTGRSDRTVVVGSHLDSVPEGPGINDNGSGSAEDLEIALQMSKLGIKPTNKVRFAFWGAEESGLLGSEYYVSQLTARQRKNIAVNLNFDMVGSPNYVRFVYDGDGSDTGADGPNGSATVESVFNEYFASQGLASEATAFDGRSDYGPFIDAGIPAGGLFSGAEGIKTPEQAMTYGGTAGTAYDPCYHLACDVFGNFSRDSLNELSDAAAHATLVFAKTSSAVNGTDNAKGKAVGRMDYDGSHLKR